MINMSTFRVRQDFMQSGLSQYEDRDVKPFDLTPVLHGTSAGQQSQINPC